MQVQCSLVQIKMPCTFYLYTTIHIHFTAAYIALHLNKALIFHSTTTNFRSFCQENHHYTTMSNLTMSYQQSSSSLPFRYSPCYYRPAGYPFLSLSFPTSKSIVSHALQHPPPQKSVWKVEFNPLPFRFSVLKRCWVKLRVHFCT